MEASSLYVQDMSVILVPFGQYTDLISQYRPTGNKRFVSLTRTMNSEVFICLFAITER